MAEQSLKEFYDSLIGASTNWHKIEHNWPAIACVFAFAVSGLYTFSGAVAGSFGHNILWLAIFSVTDPTALILLLLSVLPVYPHVRQQRIAHRCAAVQIGAVHVHGSDLAVVVGGVVVHATVGIAAAGV